MHEGWLKPEGLAGISDDKLQDTRIIFGKIVYVGNYVGNWYENSPNLSRGLGHSIS